MASPDSAVLVSGQPSAGSELGDAIDREVSQARQGRAKIVANRDFWSSAGFDGRDDLAALPVLNLFRHLCLGFHSIVSVSVRSRPFG
jgi:hypothetical protein